MGSSLQESLQGRNTSRIVIKPGPGALGFAAGKATIWSTSAPKGESNATIRPSAAASRCRLDRFSQVASCRHRFSAYSVASSCELSRSAGMSEAMCDFPWGQSQSNRSKAVRSVVLMLARRTFSHCAAARLNPATTEIGAHLVGAVTHARASLFPSSSNVSVVLRSWTRAGRGPHCALFHSDSS
jgi:hypothetical protein